MKAQLRSELYKLRSTWTVASVVAAMLALVTLAVLLHGFGLSASRLTSLPDQRGVFTDVGVNLGALFAGLLGALSITGEIRSGTIRPTLLVTPRRGLVELNLPSSGAHKFVCFREQMYPHAILAGRRACGFFNKTPFAFAAGCTGCRNS